MVKILARQLFQILKARGLVGLISYLWEAFNYRVINTYLRGSFSQKGEDLLIYKYFKGRDKGFYVDIGASHPSRLSNTNYFYKRGWRGINVEPDPKRLRLFKKERERDINLNLGIGPKRGKFDFVKFEAAAFSTFSKKEAQALVDVGYKKAEKIRVRMLPLKDILSKFAEQNIDFMSIDTEGMDIEVLQSNDWKKFRPQLLCIETIDFIDLLNTGRKVSPRKREIDNYLKDHDYIEYFYNGLNTIYERKT